MKIHILMHESFESPGAITAWATNNQHIVSFSKPFNGDPIPDNADAFDFLIIMGGPQSPSTTPQQCPYFHAEAEMALIRNTIANNKYVLGICLGAQLIGQALGADFAHSPEKEIGVFSVHLTAAAQADPIFKYFPSSFPVAHWHGDMPGITQDAEVLAYSTGCPRQIVRYAAKVYGFQCHFELTPDDVANMIAHNQQELAEAKGLPFVQSNEALMQQDYASGNQLLFKFLDLFTKH